jgi:hypothetical protein
VRTPPLAAIAVPIFASARAGAATADGIENDWSHGPPSEACYVRAMKAITAALLVVIDLTGPALAWGSEGHRIVAEIAEQYLEPATARRVRELLAIENATTLAQVSTWADEIRPQRRETAPWHFVDIPTHPSATGHASRL